jgi:hypothetical protein
MSFTLFADFGINIKDKLLGQVGREMAFFFNGIECNSIYETKKPIIFFSNQDHKNIFTTFMNFFNKKDEHIPIYYSENNTGKCKISSKLNITDETNLLTIFSLNNEKIITTESSYFGINGDIEKLNEKKYWSLDDIIEFKTIKTPATAKATPATATKAEPATAKATPATAKANPLKSIYFYNPMIKYLYLLINFAYHTKFSVKDNISELDKTQFYIVCNFFIYKFIKFITEQGRNIITTLEHLKFFFLSRVDGIKGYNQDALNKETQQTQQTQQTNGNKAFLFNSLDAALTQDKTYIIPMKYGTTDIEEKVNLGQFNKFKLLSMLQDLAGNQSHLLKLNQVSYGQGKYPDLMTPLESGLGETPNKFGAIFVMFANIKAYIRDPSTYGLTNTYDNLKKELPKLCTAEFDTLEFAESISSTTYNKNLAITDVSVATKRGGGGNKKNLQYRNKKGNIYYLSTKNKSTLKKFFASRQHSIYSRRSKKYFRL